ncbi:NAD(P)/FAD-dependent oxidoreductase [Oceanidesulfovibrio marinus]|uniref:NAD(P)/FAD-dependent oxidoreductase n=1 Tax=Oceanidesulfovibrio marinus TaxID=370038 RepID=A0A6P1ZLX6_9BACT|nr:NAD(P)/FAD-dependent oxidoreductase [Oceanidesulfovibrio marinus]QJT08263.1 NAD(P)/FAD-dependent oxidoreductase [Oceanidesulfovibrio marinus]TVM35156.1 NAD(P)/FAD-dependent oxidoreductase [Oceanidesulfovibrio marinus]
METKQITIIGAGPAGLSAAIYAARAGLSTLVLGCQPKIAGDYEIDNYFGFPETISGKELIERGRAQAERFGAEIRCDRVLSIHMDEDMRFTVKTKDTEIKTCAVILATGVSRVKPGIDNLGDYEGKGVSYCVSCDGFFFRGKKVVVIGEAFFAANQALELTNYTPDITIITQGKAPTMNGDYRTMLDEASIPVLEKKVTRLEGENGLERIVFEDGETMDADGLFVAIGEASSSDFAYTLGIERKGVFLVADDKKATNIPGVFAAGDCLGGFLQISVAVGEGAVAAKSAIGYVKKECADMETT